MIRLFLLLFVLSLSTFFMFTHYFFDVDDSDGKVDTIGFWLNPIRIRADTYIWMLCEHLVIVGLAVVAVLQEGRYKKAVMVFVFLQGIDTVGWLLAYDDLLKDLPFTFNEVKIVIFIFTIGNELLWNTTGKR